MIGTSAQAPPRLRMTRVASSPSISGMRMSMKMTSNWNRSTAATASSPSAATWVATSNVLSIFTATSWLVGLSSAISTCSGRPRPAMRALRMATEAVIVMLVEADRVSPRQRHDDAEGRALAEGGGERDRSAHLRDDALADRQAEAGAAIASGDRGIRLHEVAEQRIDLVGGDADAGVADGPFDRYAVGFPGQTACGHEDVAGGGELHRIGQKVQQHLAQPPGVADQGGRQRGVVLGAQRQPLCRCARRDDAEQMVDQHDRRKGELLEFELAGVELRIVENVVEDAQQALARFVNREQHLALLGVEVGFEQRVGQAEHAVHRRADFMAHGGEEERLGAARHLRRAFLLAQLLRLGLDPQPLRLGAPAFGDVLVHGDPAAAVHVPARQGDDAAVGQVHGLVPGRCPAGAGRPRDGPSSPVTAGAAIVRSPGGDRECAAARCPALRSRPEGRTSPRIVDCRRPRACAPSNMHRPCDMLSSAVSKR